jgi:RCC1 and BTB domain-containing protein
MVMVTCGWSHTAALDENGQVYTFGNGDHGKLGHGDNAKATVPRVVEGLQHLHIASIASYNEHTAALTSRDAVSCTTIMSVGFLNDLKRLVGNEAFSDVVFIVEVCA